MNFSKVRRMTNGPMDPSGNFKKWSPSRRWPRNYWVIETDERGSGTEGLENGGVGPEKGGDGHFGVLVPLTIGQIMDNFFFLGKKIFF
jgi:hypothetical protein